MKKKRKMKIGAKILLLLIFILFIAFLGIFVKYKFFDNIDNTPLNPIIFNPIEVPTVIKLNKVTNNTKVTINEKWQEVIQKYLDSYYKSLVNLEVEDPRNMFVDPDGVEAYLTYKATELIVNHHKMQDNDMHLTEAVYEINYTSITTKNNTVTIDFKRNDDVNFKFLNGIHSKTYNMSNTFVLKEVDGEYKIDSIRIVQDYYIMFTRALNFNASDLKTKIDNLYNKYIDNSKKELENNRKLIESAPNYKASKKYDVAYNREAALNYANEYVTKRNPAYQAYDDGGGNCMNFASQTMYAGGIPLDKTGSATWYHQSTMNKGIGKTYSWTSTNYFYSYAKNNTGYGLVSEVDANLFTAEPGDIAQVGFDGYSHTTIVVGQVKKDDKVVDVLINCNTLSLENYPLLAYVYQNKRLIKILGYNK